MRHMTPLACNKTPKGMYCYCQLFVQGLICVLRTQVTTKFRGHLGVQLMTHNAQMTLLEEAISVAQANNLEIGMIAEVVHSTQLRSLSAIAQAASIDGRRYTRWHPRCPTDGPSCRTARRSSSQVF